MSAATVRVVQDTKFAGLEALAKRMRSLKSTVLVGVPKGATEADGTPMALVAAVNEFGSSDGRIPERSFLRAGIRRGRPVFRRLNESSLKAIVSGTMSEQVALGRLGLAAVAAIQNEIVNGSFEPNAPSTVARKGSDKPLVDTGSLRQSITFVIDSGQVGPGVVR